MSIIEIKKLTKTYFSPRGQVTALKDVSFSVQKGEFVVITGPSGSGKSTLMNILGCLDRPTSGMYYLKGRDVSRMGSTQLASIRNRSVGFVFQSCDLIPGLTALENVWLPLYYRGVPRKRRNAIAMEALQKVELNDRASYLPRELSGGQRQRVAIARALAANPDIILADEPTGSLDSKVGGEITSILKQIAADGGTVIVITHDDSLARSSERVITICDGCAEQKG